MRTALAAVMLIVSLTPANAADACYQIVVSAPEPKPVAESDEIERIRQEMQREIDFWKERAENLTRSLTLRN